MTPGSGPCYRHRLREPFKYEVRETRFGTSYGAHRPAEEHTTYWRIAHFLFPCFTMTPTPAACSSQAIRMWVPVEDEHVVFWSVAASGPERARRAHEYLADSSDWLGRFRPTKGIENDYLVDREAQKSDTCTGIGGRFVMQDTAATGTIGALTNRSKEHLGVSDTMIIRARKRLLDAVRALDDGGIVPPGVDDPEVFGTRSSWLILPTGVDWWDGSRELRQAFVDAREEGAALSALDRT